MSYRGPEIPDDNFDDHERISDEDVLRDIKRFLDPEQGLPKDDEEAIRDFFTRFNIKGSVAAGNDKLEILWERFNQNPSLIRDFSYILMDVKTDLALSTYPLQIGIDELLEYSNRVNEIDYFSPRVWLIDHKAVPNLIKFGFDEEKIRRNAFGEIYDSPRAGEATRFLGWLTGQRFLSGLQPKFEKFIEEQRITKPSVTHLAALCTLEVVKNLENLKKQRDTRIGSERTIETATTPRYEEAVMAMEAINNMCMHLFKGQA